METTDIQAKSTKDRLDELRELFDGGYVTESEFKIARVNILDDGGIDVVTQVQHAHRAYFQEDERGGCGCFLAVLLAAFLIFGVAFFAAPYWPERLGGTAVRGAREWLTVKSAEFLGRFFGVPDGGLQLPDPVVSGDVTEPSQTEPLQTGPSQEDDSAAVPEPPAELSGDAPLVSFDLQVPQRPSVVPEPIPAALTVIEVQAPVSEEPAPAAVSVDLRAEPENAIRGVITAQNARIRSAADTSTNDNVVGWGRAGDRFVVLEEGAGGDGSIWYQIAYENGDKRGWISGSLVRLER